MLKSCLLEVLMGMEHPSLDSMQEQNIQSKISKGCGKEEGKLSAYLKFLFELLLHLLLHCVLGPQLHIHHHWGPGPLLCAFQLKTTCLHVVHLVYKVPGKDIVSIVIEKLHFHENTVTNIQCVKEKLLSFYLYMKPIYIHTKT